MDSSQKDNIHATPSMPFKNNIIPAFLNALPLDISSSSAPLALQTLKTKAYESKAQNVTNKSKMVQSFHQGSIRQLVAELLIKNTNSWWSQETSQMVNNCSLDDIELTQLPPRYIEAVTKIIDRFIDEIYEHARVQEKILKASNTIRELEQIKLIFIH